MLAYWPHLAKDHEVRLRPSLIKFESRLNDLNVVRVRQSFSLGVIADNQLAKYQTAFLNRQFIIIMCANNIPERLIIELFQDAVNNIKGLSKRIRNNRMTQEDERLISMCSHVRKSDRAMCLKLMISFPCLP